MFSTPNFSNRAGRAAMTAQVNAEAAADKAARATDHTFDDLLIERRSAKAILVAAKDSSFTCWLPLSQIRVVETADAVLITVPGWLARDKSLI